MPQVDPDRDSLYPVNPSHLRSIPTVRPLVTRLCIGISSSAGEPKWSHILFPKRYLIRWLRWRVEKTQAYAKENGVHMACLSRGRCRGTIIQESFAGTGFLQFDKIAGRVQLSNRAGVWCEALEFHHQCFLSLWDWWSDFDQGFRVPGCRMGF
jgi:hypothetical protein